MATPAQKKRITQVLGALDSLAKPFQDKFLIQSRGKLEGRPDKPGDKTSRPFKSKDEAGKWIKTKKGGSPDWKVVGPIVVAVTNNFGWTDSMGNPWEFDIQIRKTGRFLRLLDGTPLELPKAALTYEIFIGKVP